MCWQGLLGNARYSSLAWLDSAILVTAGVKKALEVSRLADTVERMSRDAPSEINRQRRPTSTFAKSGTTMRKRVIFAAIVTLTGIAWSRGAAAEPQARTLTYASPLAADMDDAALRDAVNLIADAVDEDELRGAVVFVARRGKIVLHEAIGWRDADNTLPMQKDTLFRMASNSKALTAAGILLLVQDGRLALDDPIHKHLPSFDTPATKSITIRQLLTHTSGLRTSKLFLSPLLTPEQLSPDASRMVQEVLRFAEIGAAEDSGSSYHYNNAGYNILAGLIEAETGSYEDHLKTRIYEPLGMQDSCNHESKADHKRMSSVFKRNPKGGWGVRWQPGDDPNWPFARGSGGMISTAKEYAIFCQMLCNGGVYGGHRILAETLVAEATNPQKAHIAAAERYGLGWMVREPGGTFLHSGSDGTWVWVDPRREIIGMLLTQTQRENFPRQVFRELVNRACLDDPPDQPSAAPVFAHAEGFYKDIFMSGGVNLTSRKKLYAAESLGLSYEYYAGKDPWRQSQLVIGGESDTNGVLLYPDGQPRFRMLYVNGGGATKHGKSLSKQGRQRIRNFNASGGAYCGSCAGSFLSGRNVDARTERRLGYLHIFPYNTLNTGLKKARVGHLMPDASPLLKYRDFGGDQQVDDIYHNNGNWLSTTEGDHLQDTEVLATYVHSDHKTHGGAAIWAYRKNGTTGRVLNIGSHPEGIDEGERLALAEACFLYTLDGVGGPRIKGSLSNGVPRVMDRQTSDNDPAFTRIGDRQYHHFQFEVTADKSFVRLRIESDSPAHLRLYMNKDSPAFRGNATHQTSTGNKSVAAQLTPGLWHASVQCAATVDAINDEACGFYRYLGDKTVLNGIAYTIQLDQSDGPLE